MSTNVILSEEDLKGKKQWITPEELENKGLKHVENSVDNVDNNL